MNVINIVVVVAAAAAADNQVFKVRAQLQFSQRLVVNEAKKVNTSAVRLERKFFS